MLREGREHERKPLLTWDADGIFFIEVNGERHLFDTVKDISVSGAGIQLPVPLSPATPVALGFEQDESQLQVQATVVWCQAVNIGPNSDETSHHFCMGIRFNPMDVKNSSMLFTVLREFIEPLGTPSPA